MAKERVKIASSEQSKNAKVEFLPEIPQDYQTQDIIFRLSQEPTYIGRLAKKVWGAIEKSLPELSQEPEDEGSSFSLPDKLVESITPEEWQALLYEIEEERLRYGVKTERLLEFEQSREEQKEHIRVMKEKLGWEQIKVAGELMLESEKKESVLFSQLDTVVQNLAREMGFVRPVVVEISRVDNFNAFILSVSKEGGIEKKSQVPLRFYINAGLIDKAQSILKEKGKNLTFDHLAIILGHEMAHLKQPAYDPDHPPQDAEEAQRYEYDADLTALETMDRAGYNPLSGIEMFQVMLDLGNRKSEILGQVFEHRHPVTENRFKEMWQFFQQPDHPFFSAQKKPEELSPQVLNEVSRLLRRETNDRIEKAESLADWERIIGQLENDPQMTLRDVEIIGRRLKMHMDARTALATATRAVEDGEGLGETVLYLANLIQQRLASASSGKYFDFGNISQKITGSKIASVPNFSRSDKRNGYSLSDLITDISKHETVADLKKEYVPGQRLPDQEQRLHQFIITHLVDQEVLTTQHFKTTAELFDTTNPQAVDFWSRLAGNIPRDPAIVATAKADMINSLAKTVCFGVKHEVNYTGEVEIKAIKEFVNLVKEAVTKETSQPTAETSSLAWDIAQASRLFDQYRQRVATYVEQSKPIKVEPGVTPPSPPRERFSCYTQLQDYPQRVPEEALQLAGGQIGGDLTPLQQVLARYFQASRRIFERTLSADFVKTEYNLAVPDNSESRQLLFDGYFRDFFFKLPEGGQRFQQQAQQKDMSGQTELFDYARFLYTTRGNLIASNYYDNDYPCGPRPDMDVLLTHYLHQASVKDSPVDLADYLDKIRLLANHHLLSGQQGEISNNNKIGEILKQLGWTKTTFKSFQEKKGIFERWLRGAMANGPEKDRGRRSDDRANELVREISHSLATGQQLPPEFHWLRVDDFQGIGEKVRQHFGKLPKRAVKGSYAESWRKQAIRTYLSAEFMRLMADNKDEINQCGPETIELDQIFPS